MNWVRLALLVLCSVLVAQAQTPSATVTPSTTTLAATGGEVTFTVTMNYSGQMASVGFEVLLPSGWTFAGSAGPNRPDLNPAVGQTTRFEFAYLSIPPSPVSFTFRAAYSAGLTGSQTIGGINAFFRSTGDGSLVSARVPDLVLTAPSASGGDGGGSGGGGGGGGGGGTTPVAPAFVAHPVGGTLNAGGSLALTVVVTGSVPVTYQWRKDGAVVAGATNSLLLLSNVGASSAGTYSVVASNSAGSVTSNSATVVVTGVDVPEGPRITTQPAAQAVPAGSAASFTVVATGSTPLLYQWLKDGVAIANATSSRLSLSGVQPSAAGNYTVRVTNTVGTATSDAARLTVTAEAPATVSSVGSYSGTMSGGGSFALLVREDRSVAFLGRLGPIGLMAREGTVDTAGQVRFTAIAVGGTAAPTADLRRAAAAVEYAVTGTITPAGAFSATISGLNATMTASRAAATGAANPGTGFYQARAIGLSAETYVLVGPTGNAFVLMVAGGVIDSGSGTADETGRLDVRSARGAVVTGLAGNGIATVISEISGQASTTFIGTNDAVRTAQEKLVNISTRSQTSAATQLIAGFVVGGTAPKPVLIRAIGPTLATFGVSGALAAARVEVFRGSTLVATGDDWGRATNATDIIATTSRVGAFSLPAGSRDATVLLTLEPGAYTAAVSGQTGGSGVSLIEIYDAADAGTAGAQRLINISTRAVAGTGDNTLIAGFVINGVVPKRLLVRGAGPALAQFGVTGVLPQPRLGIFSGTNQLAQNAGWSSSTDAAAIADASATVGAFAFPADSRDAAIIINLAPGSYTAQVSDAAGGSGNALLEVYELP